MMFTKWRVQMLECTLAGLKAKLAATREVVGMVLDGTTVPGSVVYDMRDLPRQIAELEERRRQLLGPNSK